MKRGMWHIFGALGVLSIALVGVTPRIWAAPPVLPSDGPVYFQFNNLEQIDTSLSNGIVVPGGSIDVNGDGDPDTPASEGNWGVFLVSSIQNGGVATPHQDINGGLPFYFDDGPGGTTGQVSGIFYGITTTSATTATGGYIDIIWKEAGSDDITAADLNGAFAPTNRTAANLAGKFTNGQLLVRLRFSSGIIPGDTTTHISSSIDITNITGTGLADSFAEVVDVNDDGVIDANDGPWAPALNGDWFWVDDDNNGTPGEAGELRDLRLGTFFNLLAAWDDPGAATNGILGLRSNDPGRFYVSFNCCVDIEKEIMVDGVWYDHDDCVDAPLVQAPHDGEYRLIVTNCGNTTLTNALINDPTLGVVDVPIADLAPGETRTLTSGDIPALGTQTICMSAGEFPNTASITADCTDGTVPSVSDEDSSCLVCNEEQPEECRVTAGGNKDGLTIPCELKSNGMPDPTTCADKGPDTWGGQAGAPPRTDGNWTHHHHPNNKDTFVFHSNDLFDITCSDPGPICEPSSAPSPDRQIDFSGIGRFNNKHGDYAGLPDGDLCFRVHLEDLGEPGQGGTRNDIDPTSCSHCPGTPITNDPDCEHCTDYYMIRIYDSPAYDPDTHDCTGNLLYFNGAPSYDVCNQPGDPLLDGYYVRAGNVQMHTDNNGGSVGNEEICYDGIDNDGDGLIDAADPDCYSTETSCNDGIDNDLDGFCDLPTSTCTDGSTPGDPDCQTCTPTADKEHGKTCSDGFDNDCDGLIDAADPDC